MARPTIKSLELTIEANLKTIESLTTRIEEKDLTIKRLYKQSDYHESCYKNENRKHIFARFQRDVFRDQRNRAQEEWAIVVAEMKTDTQLANQNRNLCDGEEAIQ